MKASNLKLGLAVLGLLALVILGGTGCESFGSSPRSSLASVTITNQPMSAVQAAVSAVFQQHGFTGGQTGVNEFTFNRPGSRMDDFAYGSALFQETVTVKVVVTTYQSSSGVIEVGCNAWLIEAENDAVFQDSHRARLLRKWPYEQLLDDVKMQLGR